MQAETPALREDGIPDRPGVLNGVHIAVTLGKAVGGGELFSGGDTALIQRVLQKLCLGLTHPLGHVDGGGGLVPNQIVPLLRLVVVEGIGHHVPEGIGPAAAVRISEDHAGLHNDAVFGAQVAVFIVDVLGPLVDGLVRAPAGVGAAGAIVCLSQAAQEIQEGIVGLIYLIQVAGGDGLGVGAPHGGVVPVEPAGGPGIRVQWEHLLLLLIDDAVSAWNSSAVVTHRWL